jgi:hypothetical protein
MADNKLNYQQARQVRKSKFSDMLLDQLAQKDTGVLGAVGKTISLRGQARIKGIKEKFDPLNIIKFMTMGSRFGPALFGKMTGRNQKDIDYFTGRTKSVVGSRNTADKLKKPGGFGDSEGINEQLSKIFSFLKSNREEDVKLRQLSKNSEEEIAYEKGKRHKEMIQTLEKLMKQINSGGTATTVKESGSSFLDGILSSLRDMMDMIRGIKDAFGGMGLIRGLASWAPRLISFIASPAGLIIGLVSAAGYITYESLQKQQKNLDDAAKTGDVGKTQIEAARTIDFMNPEGALYNPNLAEDTMDLTQQSLKDAGTPESLKAAAELEAAREIAKRKEKEKKAFLEKLPQFGGEQDLYAQPEALNNQQMPNSAASASKARSDFSKSDPRLIKVEPDTAPPAATPVSPAPASSPVSSLTNTNVDLNLTSTNSTTANKNPIVSNTTNVSNNQQRSGLRPSEISVRNDEPTFMRLIQGATRLV